MQSRIKTAIEFLKDSKSFLVGDLRLGVNELGDMEVTGWSQYTNFQNLTKTKSLEELAEIRYLFSEMLNTSPELRIFIEGRSIKFNLWFDDYGKASIGICSEMNGVVRWEADIEN